MTRIGLIRTAITAVNPERQIYQYFADGVNGDAVYKVYAGLDLQEKLDVIELLNKDPSVDKAYLSRRYTNYYGHDNPRHLKVRFKGIADSVTKAVQTSRKKRRRL